MYEFRQLRSSNPRDYKIINLTFGMIWQKFAYTTKYLRKYWTIYTKFFSDEWLWLKWYSFLHHSWDQGNQLTCEAIHRYQNWPPSLFALVFQNRLKYRNIDEWIYIADDPSTLCKNYRYLRGDKFELLKWYGKIGIFYPISHKLLDW